MTLKRLTGLDSALLAAEMPGTLLHLMAVMVLDPMTVPGGYSFAKFRDFIAHRLHLVPPLRRRLLEVPFGLGRPAWIDDPELEIDFHLRRAAVPSPGGPIELAQMAAKINERPLDRSRPLWEIVVVEGVEGGQIALLAKLHHSMMDGMAGMQFMASLFSRVPELEEPPRSISETPDPVPGGLSLLTRAVPSLVGQPARAARAVLQSLNWRLGRALTRAGDEEPEPAPTPVSRTWLNARTSPYRSVAYTSVSLGQVRQVCRSSSVTVNDVVLALVAGALRGYLDEIGELPTEPLVAGAPISTHEEGDDLAVAYSALFVSLATDIEDPFERLQAIREASHQAKRRQRVNFSERLALWFEVPPPFVFTLLAQPWRQLRLADRIDPLCNLIVSSVPGPPIALYFGGARLTGLYPLGPIYDGMTLNVTALSREDDIDIGLVACRSRIPDLWALAAAVPSALDELLHALPGPQSAAGAH